MDCEDGVALNKKVSKIFRKLYFQIIQPVITIDPHRHLQSLGKLKYEQSFIDYIVT